jgi:hypothetical protein
MLSDKRTAISFAIGLLLCVGIWWAVPYNNFALNNSFISDSYLPEIVVLCLVVLVLILNPILRCVAPTLVLEHRQLAWILSMLLFAAILPSNGLLRFFPHCVALNTEQINRSPTLAPAVEKSKLPPALFPDRIGFDLETPVASQLVDELQPGAAIPWSAWFGPLLAWGSVIVAFWVLLVGLGLMVYPQWLNTERLAFPLLRVYHALLDEPEPGQAFPTLFRSPQFWVGCGTVVFIHSTNGLAIFTRGAFPAFPVGWDLSGIFTEGIWQYAPGFLRQSRIYFLFVGLACFMPNRYSFSLWFTGLFFGLVLMYAGMYWPTFDSDVLYDQGAGALIAMAGGVVWLGRQHYWRVLCAACGRGGPGPEAPTHALAGRMFLAGVAGMLGWFMWAGAGFWWSGLFVVTAVIIMLMVTRIVAETGLVYVWVIPLTVGRLIGLFPSEWKSIATVFLQQAHYVLVNRASAVSAAAMTVLALGLSRGAPPQSRRQLAGLGIIVLVLGLLVCGAVHLHMGYNLATSFDGINQPITGRGATQMGLGPVLDLAGGRSHSWDFPQLQRILWGAGLAGALLWLCARFPGWPLHPIGLIFVNSSIGLRLVPSLFLGWALKSLLVRFGGARAFRVTLPFFLGLILGEIFANALWTIVPVVQLLLGADPSTIQHLIIFQYT